MMERSRELSEGLESLVDLTEYRQIDLQFNRATNCWVLHFSLSPPVFPNRYVPDTTRWYGLISLNYPFGSLEFYPDKVQGIAHTFPHQLFNGDQGKYAWRSGNICVRTKLASWEQRGFDREPRTAVNRLRWHVERALYWLECAATNRLTLPGDPFELPDVPAGVRNRIAFSETPSQLSFWTGVGERAGLVTGRYLRPGSEILVLNEFEAGEQKLTYAWEAHVSGTGKPLTGIWLRLDAVPVTPPWQVPLQWSELKKIGEGQGLLVLDLLREQFLKQWKRSPSFVLFGFPVPKNVGELPERFHWFGCSFPELPPANGFRPQSGPYLESASKRLFSGSKIKWRPAENWAKDQITNRGLLHGSLLGQSVLLIGAGAVGSLVAELLVRLGLETVTVVDPDKVMIGNFSRHTLTMDDLERPKAEALAKRLNAIFPHVRAGHFAQSLGTRLAEDPEFINGFDLVIDATASDEVLHLLERKMVPPQVLVSLSTGIKAGRLYAFFAGEFENLSQIFTEKTAPWLQKDNEEKEGLALPMEGAGCWHPLFPARYDAIMTLVSAAVPQLEAYLADRRTEPKLVVVERTVNGGVLTSLKIINESS